MTCPACGHPASVTKHGRHCPSCGWVENQSRELITQATADNYQAAIDLYNAMIDQIDETLEELG
jgi:transcription elongation factor Elf1